MSWSAFSVLAKVMKATVSKGGRQFDGYRRKVSTPVCATNDGEEDSGDADAA